MESMKLLLVFSVQIWVAHGLAANSLINLPEIQNVFLKWPESKEATLLYLLDALTDVGNATLIGWQQIFSETGTLKEIRTIELTLFGDFDGDHSFSTSKEIPNEKLDVEEILDLQDLIETAPASTGLSVSGSLQQWDRYGSLENLLYVDKENMFNYNSGEGFLNWQQNLTVDSMSSVETAQRVGNWPISVLKWNSDGSFSEESVVKPEVLVTVTDAYKATAEMVDTFIKGLSEAVLKEPEEVTVYLHRSMNAKFPDYMWQVFEGDPTVLLIRDVYITAQSSLNNIRDPDVQMSIFGVQKSS